MRQSKLFTKTLKEAPRDESSANARFLEQAGFVQKVMAGVYSYLPLGWRVLGKIENIVREEMNAIGGQEVLLPALHPKELWMQTGRWSTVDVLFHLKSQHDLEYALGATHEEVVTPMAGKHINSYKDLPFAVYQIQTKFRDELRAKSGIMRGREFRMKDLYSFHATENDLDLYYESVKEAYYKIFKRCGLNPFYTEASGGDFTKYSHEFQEEIPAGEDVIYVCEKCGLAKNREIYEPDIACTDCGNTKYRETKAAEVGNIFKLKTKFSEPFNAKFTDSDGAEKFATMGCYGIGPTRMMGVVVEKYHDEKGIIWPVEIAPFTVHLIGLNSDKSEVVAKTIEIYQRLVDAGIEVLYDDRDLSAGAKFADADLIGIPHRVVVSTKTLEQESVEVKNRSEQKPSLIKTKELMEHLKTH